MNAYARLTRMSSYHPGPPFIVRLLNASLPLLPDFKSQELVNVLHAYSRLLPEPNAAGIVGNAFVRGFTQCALALGMDSFRSQELGNTANAIATLSLYQHDEAFWQGFLDAVSSNCGRFNPQDLAMTLHGIARVRDKLPGPFLHRYEKAIMSSPPQGNY